MKHVIRLLGPSAIPFLGVVIACVSLSAANAATYERTYTLDADFDEGVMDGVNHTEVADQLQLDKTSTTFPFAWIANSGEGTISKIDTATNTEVARYRTGPNGGADSPSRTAVDVDGNCWVANRAHDLQGTVIKILLEGGVDRNNNGVIDTSTGPADVKLWWEDERVELSVAVGAPRGLPRSLAIDKDGNVWVGLYNQNKYAVLDGTTGAWLADVPTAHGPYGAVVDANGILWSACLSWGIDKIDTVARTYLKSYALGGGYGITVDTHGFVWVGAYGNGGVYKFDPPSETAQYFPSGNAWAGRGVCVAPTGNIWVALGYGSPNNLVAKYSTNGNLLGMYPVGVNPCGVGTDFDGNIIVVCQDSQEVYKLNEADGSEMWRLTVGSTPYTYSDFTGYIIRNITQKTGTWSVVFDSEVTGTPWGKVSWNSQEPEDTSVTVQVRAAETVGDLAGQPWTDVSNGVDVGALAGQFIQIRARLTTTTQESPILYDLTIEAENQPPDCGNASPSVSQIWPPNHNWVPIDIVGVTDPDGDPLTITITKITQDEPTNEKGDGNTCPDGAGIGASTAKVMAERSGKGNGRVYEISFTADDGKGGICSGSVQVRVPHSQNGKPCVDDGQKYDSTVCE